jgi:hypothetical protein
MSLSNPLDLPLITDAQASKHVTHNDAILKLSQAMGNRLDVSVSAGNAVVVGDTAQRNYFLSITGASASGREVQLPAKNRALLVSAVSANAHNVTLKIAGGSDTLALAPGTTALVVTTETPSLVGFFLAQVATVSQFVDLGDVPANYAGAGGKAVAVTVGEDGLEFVDFPAGGGGGVTEIVDLDDVVATDLEDGDVLLWNELAGAFLNIPIGSLGGATTLAQLTDVDIDDLQNDDILQYDSGLDVWFNTSPPEPPTGVIPSIKTSDYTLALTDTRAAIYLEDCDLIVPNDSSIDMPIGTVVLVTQWGATASEIVPISGVTVNAADTLEFAKQYASGALTKVAANTWHFAAYTTEL